MSKSKGLNETAWELIFDKYDVPMKVAEEEAFYISSSQIKEFREPRLMAKFDHSINLPDVFSNNQLSILPVTRGDYAIGHFHSYHPFEEASPEICTFSFPDFIESLDYKNITSEAVALNCALASGIINDFMDDEEAIPTVSGRMSSGVFSFSVGNIHGEDPYNLTVSNSQIEIDAAYEGINSLALIEAKRDLSEDFLVRQLYYPFRTWSKKINKPVRPIFLVFSNGIYRLYEYQFENPDKYDSLTLIKQRNYSVEDLSINIEDIQVLLKKLEIIPEPKISFPQADNFDRVVNICELLNGKVLSRGEVTEQYAFDVRQTNYYTDAARYLGLIEKERDGYVPHYELSPLGKQLFKVSYKERQLMFCKAILKHEVFNRALSLYFKTGALPNKDEVVRIMKESSLYRIDSDVTFYRRASTVRGWLNWIVSRINE